METRLSWEIAGEEVQRVICHLPNIFLKDRDFNLSVFFATIAVVNFVHQGPEGAN